MKKETNNIWEILQDIWIMLTNKIPLIKAYRERLRDRKTDKNFEDLKNKVSMLNADRKETSLLKQILNKKIFDKKRLLETIEGNYFLLTVFAFPRLPKIGFDVEYIEVIKKFLENKLPEQKRKYSLFLAEKLKFEKFGYSRSPSFFVKIKDLPQELRKIKNLKKSLEKELPLRQKEEWDLIIKILSKSKNKKIIQYVCLLKEKGFDDLYNISFYLDFINFKKENVFVQNENSFLISHFLKLEDLVARKKDLESLKDNLKFLDISLFYTSSIPKEIKEILDTNQEKIRKDLGIEHFFQEINKQDLKKVLMNLLDEKYRDPYTNTFYKKQGEFRDFLVSKGIII